jgi:hypothetical protein
MGEDCEGCAEFRGCSLEVLNSGLERSVKVCHFFLWREGNIEWESWEVECRSAWGGIGRKGCMLQLFGWALATLRHPSGR